MAGAGARAVFSRLDTSWRYDLPHRMETLVAGDTVGVGGGWSRPVRYGGIRWGRDFGMRPGYVTLPQISLAGQAALPSTVEVLVNNARRLSQPVQPGPFDLTNVPITTGAGEIGLVVRDLLGRETVVTQSYYASPRLLAPGLSDFSFESGLLRTGYGRRAAATAAVRRRYLAPGADAEADGRAARRGATRTARRRSRAERPARHLGVSAGLPLPARAADSQGAGERGGLLIAGIERSTPRRRRLAADTNTRAAASRRSARRSAPAAATSGRATACWPASAGRYGGPSAAASAMCGRRAGTATACSCSARR